MLAVLTMPKRKNRQLSTFRFDAKIRAALKLHAKAAGLSQAGLLERAFLLYCDDVRQKTQQERNALAQEAERLFGSITQDRPE